MTDPIHYADTPCEADQWQQEFVPGWYFWTETWADRCGPYASENEARQKLEQYCREVLGS